jgi:hypothetical protein
VSRGLKERQALRENRVHRARKGIKASKGHRVPQGCLALKRPLKQKHVKPPLEVRTRCNEREGVELI